MGGLGLRWTRGLLGRGIGGAIVAHARHGGRWKVEALGGGSRQLLGKVGGVPPLEKFEGKNTGRQEDGQAREHLDAHVSGRKERCRARGDTGARLFGLQRLKGGVVGAGHPAYPGANQPQEWIVVLGGVKKIGQVEGQESKVVGCIDAGVNVAKEPAVVVHESVAPGGIGRQGGVGGAQESTRGVGLVSIVELALHIGDADDDGEVAPDMGPGEAQGVAHDGGAAGRGTGDLGGEGLFALEAVEMLGEGAAAGEEVVALNEEGDEGVELVEGVEQRQQIARRAMGGVHEQIAQRRRQQAGQLLLREQLEERRLLVVEAVAA